MPYKALYNGSPKPPQSVPENTTVECPECGDEMHIVKSHKRETGAFVSRHFRHNRTKTHGGGGGGRSCGESNEHIKLKSIAHSKLKHIFEDRFLKCELEYTLHETVSDSESRDADALLLFDETDEQLGQGVAVEVQVENKSKDKDAVTRDYIKNNISIVWVTPDDFGEHDMRLNEADLRARARRAVWPEHVPDRRKWTRAKHAPDHLRWDNNSVDRFQIGRFDLMAGDNNRDVSIPATFSRPVLDEIRYYESDWSALFTDYHERHFRIQASIPAIDSSRQIKATVAESWLDTQRYTEIAWPSLFRPTAEKYLTTVTATSPVLDIPFPPEYAEQHRDELLKVWQRGKGEYNFDLRHELADNNAPRRCAECGDEADVYIYQDGVISQYRCQAHIPTEA